MNVMSLNIRGVSESHKIDWIRDLKSKNKIDFIGIQETHASVASTIDVGGCWGSNSFDYEAVDSTGKSGGLLSIWKPEVFSKSNSFSSRHFLAITGHWKGFEDLITFVNVYAPQSISTKENFGSN